MSDYIHEQLIKQYKHLTSPKLGSVLRVHSEIRKALGDYLRSEGFIEIPPVIISAITDPLRHATGKAEVEYYGHKYQLTKSMIFHKQLAVMAYDKIFTFSPNIRLEPVELADTGRHLIEFTQLDLEIKNGTREQIVKLGEGLITHVIKSVIENCAAELSALGRKLSIPNAPFERLTYKEAYEKYMGNFEIILSQQYKDPFWIMDIPIEAREFYDKEDETRKGILKDMDLVYPEGYGEALSGGEREYEFKRVAYRIGRSGVDLEDFDWYLEFVKLGIPPSAGFGIGVERLTRYICGLKTIEDTVLFPKMPGQLGI